MSENHHGGASDSGRESGNKGRSLAEWTTLGMSIAIIAVILVLISLLYIRGAEEPPRIVTEPHMEELRHEESGYYLPVDVTNEGDHTVENLVVQAELDTGSGQPQTAEFSLNFVAGGETMRGTFVFKDDPADGELTIGAVSYTEP